jgi:radical SAM-linked protein
MMEFEQAEDAATAETDQIEDEGAVEIARQRLRILYSKGEAIQFISHQDEFRMWERTLRRADLPLVYKLGFNPQPMIQFAAPLGVGMTGVREYLDVTLAPPVDVAEVKQRLRAALPVAVGLHAVEEIPLKAEALATSLFGADYTVLLDVTPEELTPEEVQARIDDFWAKTEIWRERERKGERYTYNLRPLVFELAILPSHLSAPFAATAPSAITLFVRVQQRNGATGRPDEVVAALGLDDYPRLLQRDRLYFGENPEDVAAFAAYPEVTRAMVAGEKLGRKQQAKPTYAEPRGRNIAERAADEFV